MRFRWPLLLFTLAVLPARALALNVGSDASDGILSVVSSNLTIDLSLAPTAAWDTPSDPGTQHGVYDPQKWAVVFKYDSVYVASGRMVTFVNHPAMAPVVWLVNRGVKINGRVNLDGTTGTGGTELTTDFAAGGPGGFRGGIGTFWYGTGSPGFGPGGGQYAPVQVGGGGSYGTDGQNGGPQYGNDRILPLVGGSGGAGSGFGSSKCGGGGGGGAILVASNRTIEVGTLGYLQARGAYGGGAGYPSYQYGGSGSGGAIRLIADSITGTVQALNATAFNSSATGTHGGDGRIRFETNHLTVIGNSSPPYTYEPLVSDTADIWPTSDLPAVRVTHIGGQPVPADPRANFNGPGDVSPVAPDNVEVLLEATNVPVDATWAVTLRLAPTVGDEALLDAALVGGNQTLSSWRVTLPPLTVQRCSAIQARAHRLIP